MNNQGQGGAGGGIDYQAQMARNIAFIAESLQEIAAGIKATSAIFEKWETKGLPPSYTDMAEAFRPQVPDLSRTDLATE